MDVGLFHVHLLSHVAINSLYRGRFDVYASELCSLNRGFCYIEVRYMVPGCVQYILL